jgi:exoribonuclease R
MEKAPLIGPISINSKGVGFFDPNPEVKDRTNSIEIQPTNVNRAFHGDIVEVELLGQKIKNREQGKVVRIVQRMKEELTTQRKHIRSTQYSVGLETDGSLYIADGENIVVRLLNKSQVQDVMNTILQYSKQMS